MTEASAVREQLREAAEHVRAQHAFTPRVGLILGTGLGAVAERIEVQAELGYDEIPHMPPSTVASHAGRLILGTLEGVPVAAMQGRYHAYEGYSLQQVVLPVRLLRLLGADTLMLSGACGGMNPLWQPGELVMLSDHINLLGDNPLIGANLDELGPRFPDMSEPYDSALRRLTAAVALSLRIPLREGVYAAVAGPNLETRAEYRMLRALGADLVGMSTVPEVIAARHAGMRVLAVSIVTDLCLPDALTPTSIEEIIAHASRAEPVLAQLVCGVLQRINEEADAVGGVE